MKQIVQGAGLVLAMLFASPAAQAQAWPQKPVKVVVAFTAGGTTDTLARAVGQQLGERLKQPFIIDNKPGAGGNSGTEMVVRAPADGYTLIVNSVGPIAVNPTLYPKLPYNPLTDLVPIVQIADVPNVLVVHPSVPVRTVQEFVAHAKAHAGVLNYGSTGIGTSSHLSGYVLGKRAGIDVVHVPYKGADALRDLLAGRVQFMFATIPSVKQHIDAGSLRALAVTSVKRSRSLPDVPTVAELGYKDFDVSTWYGLFMPAGTPKEIVATVNTEVNKLLATPDMKAQIHAQGAEPQSMTPEQFSTLLKTDYAKWKGIVQASGATVE